MSARGPRFEYEIGEHVLCFEPDLTKARVLYDAKVVDRQFVKDASGKKKASYGVHFQGWNSSWDRHVADHYVLRNTDENRELMRKLADTAKRLKNGARRRKINTILHQAFGGSPPEFDDPSDSNGSDEESDAGKHRGKGKAAQDKRKQKKYGTVSISYFKTNACEFEIPDSLKAQLEDDYFLINKKNKLTRVPAKPCVIDILESFMKTFCVNYVCDPTGGREKTRNSNKHTLKCPPDKCVSLCKEFVDSLRIIFDFTLPIILLYAAEQQQYESAIAQVIPMDCISEKESASEEPPSKVSRNNLSRSKWKSSESKNNKEHSSSMQGDHQKQQQQHQQQLRSPSPVPSASSSSSSDPSPPTPPRRVTRQGIHLDQSKSASTTSVTSAGSTTTPPPSSLKHKSTGSSAQSKHSNKSQPVASTSSSSSSSSPMKGVEEDKQQREPIIPIASRTRRRTLVDYDDVSPSCPPPPPLYSVHVKHEPGIEVDSEVFLASTCATIINQPDQACFPNGQTGSGHSATGTESMTMSSCHGREDAMDRILGWQLLPPDVKMDSPTTPSQIYGTIHLLRMFVKLPDLLKKMKMKDVQLQIIIKFIHHCLQYLVNHQSELFHSQSYIKA